MDSKISQQIMEKSLDALWMKMRVHSDNISNYETPGYKTKRVNFGEVLNSKTSSGETDSVTLRTSINEDDATSSRIDGNNVDMEKEQLEVWRAQAQYSAIAQKISGKYNNIRTVISQVGR